MEFEHNEVIESAENPEVAEPEETEVAGAEEQEVAEPVQRKTDADAAFARIRRENEELKRANDIKDKALSGLFGTDDSVVQALAVAENKTPAEVKAELEIERLRVENETLKNKGIDAEVELMMKKDLQTVQAIDPNVKSLDDLGETFVNLIASGLDVTDAYYAAKAREQAEKRVPAKPPGAVNNKPAEKDFYSKEEVERMSDSEIRKNYDKIVKSQRQW